MSAKLIMQYLDLYASAIVIFEIVENCLMFAFIHGLVELNAAGHSEAEKGLQHLI
ncbi:hypothetical protein [Paenibacillus crassostreae]|uniref:hypothetical protein n=1 Tax=Paenibacillus crassostreae TaxID=1763538 RepID=UPI0012FDE5D3|nr:hypothetical protein [Paenibacillus crassostreae]